MVRWPRFYREPALTRLLYARDHPPAPEVLAAAAGAGLVGEAREWTDGDAGAECEVAVLGSRDFGAIPERLPALIASPDGGAMRLAALDAARPSLEGVAPRRGDVAATPEALADALLAPPRGIVERRKQLDYQSEDIRARPEALRIRSSAAADRRAIARRRDVDDAWDRAAKLNAALSVDRGATLGRLRAEYERADALALAYGRRWRSTLAARSLLLFVTNLVSGLIGSLFPWLSLVTLPIQFGVTALLYVDQLVSRRRRWRGKWIDYRRAAETTRIARFCVLGGAPLLASTAPSWIDWRLQRILRRGEPATPLSEADAAAFLAYLREVEIDRQVAYHRAAYRRFRRLDAHLRRAALVALVATFALGAGLAIVAAAGVFARPIPLLGAVGLALSAGPGLYAALSGLRDQLDVQRQASRAARIGLALRGLRRTLDGAPPSAALARAAASHAAEIMHDDVSSWIASWRSCDFATTRRVR